jgi:hypothetical protein
VEAEGEKRPDNVLACERRPDATHPLLGSAAASAMKPPTRADVRGGGGGGGFDHWSLTLTPDDIRERGGGRDD